jgi:hypothetical protein
MTCDFTYVEPVGKVSSATFDPVTKKLVVKGYDLPTLLRPTVTELTGAATTPVAADTTTPVAADTTTPAAADTTTPAAADTTTPVAEDTTEAASNGGRRRLGLTPGGNIRKLDISLPGGNIRRRLEGETTQAAHDALVAAQ